MMTFIVENLDVRSMRLINSPNWNFYVHRSKNVQFDDIYINDVDTVHGESVVNVLIFLVVMINTHLILLS